MKLNKQVLILLIFGSGITAILLQELGLQRVFSLFKPLTTILILLLPILYPTRASKSYRHYTILALVFSLLGDVLLLDDSRFVFGLASFLIAHILFILSFVSLDRFKFYFSPLLLLILLAGVYYAFLFPYLLDMAIPVFVYMLVIVLMCWQGINLYLWKKERAFQRIAIGALLFLLSDSLIAWNKFIHPIPLAGVFILSTYWMGIGLIANASTVTEEIVAIE